MKGNNQKNNSTIEFDISKEKKSARKEDKAKKIKDSVKKSKFFATRNKDLAITQNKSESESGKAKSYRSRKDSFMNKKRLTTKLTKSKVRIIGKTSLQNNLSQVVSSFFKGKEVNIFKSQRR